MEYAVDACLDTQAVCDLPSASFVPELLSAYPSAKLILTPRPADAWYASCQRTIHKAVASKELRFLSYLDTYFLGRFMPFLDLIFKSVFPCDPSLYPTEEGKRICVENFDRMMQEARDQVPEERRLEYRVGEGWGRLCEFLEVEQPKEDFPNVNNTGVLNAKVLAIRKCAIGRIVKRWAPFVGVVAIAAGAVASGRVVL